VREEQRACSCLRRVIVGHAYSRLCCSFRPMTRDKRHVNVGKLHLQCSLWGRVSQYPIAVILFTLTSRQVTRRHEPLRDLTIMAAVAVELPRQDYWADVSKLYRAIRSDGSSMPTTRTSITISISLSRSSFVAAAKRTRSQWLTAPFISSH
jgi:hypothetical protein